MEYPIPEPPEEIGNVKVADLGEIQAKIDEAADEGGGWVRLIPGKTYDPDSRIDVKDNVVLDFNGAEIEPTSDHDLFLVYPLGKILHPVIDVSGTTFTSNVFLFDDEEAKTYGTMDRESDFNIFGGRSVGKVGNNGEGVCLKLEEHGIADMAKIKVYHDIKGFDKCFYAHNDSSSTGRIIANEFRGHWGNANTAVVHMRTESGGRNVASNVFDLPHVRAEGGETDYGFWFESGRDNRIYTIGEGSWRFATHFAFWDTAYEGAGSNNTIVMTRTANPDDILDNTGSTGNTVMGQHSGSITTRDSSNQEEGPRYGPEKITLPEDAGAWGHVMDLPVSDAPDAGTEQSYRFGIDTSPAFEVYAEADGAGGLQNRRTEFFEGSEQLLEKVGDARFENNVYLKWFDSGGTLQDVLRLDSYDRLDLVNHVGGSRIRQNSGGGIYLTPASGSEVNLASDVISAKGTGADNYFRVGSGGRLRFMDTLNGVELFRLVPGGPVYSYVNLDLQGNSILGNGAGARVNLDDFMNLPPRDSAPGTPSVGDVCVASATWDPDGDGNGEAVIYDGAAWQELADMPNL